MVVRKKKDLIAYLVEQGDLTLEQKKQIEDYARSHRIQEVNALKELDLVDRSRAIEAVANIEGKEFVHIDSIDVAQEVLDRIPSSFASLYPLFPIRYDHQTDTLTVAVSINDVNRMQIITDTKREAKVRNVRVVIAHKQEILNSIETLYNSSEVFNALVREKKRSTAGAVKTSSNKQSKDPEVLDTEDADPMVRFVNNILFEAVKKKASDIHFDPIEGEGYLVRLRIDGIMYKLLTADEEFKLNIASIIKIKATNMEIEKTRETQDGRLSMRMPDGKDIDFRIVSLPAVGGEKIVLRVLDNSAAELPLEKLGFTEENYNKIMKIARKPYGAMLVCGPTGSGKSTTLYSTLNAIKTPEINIITVEDPVEYELEGITQVPVTSTNSFDDALRAVLRADPNVILIGEVRDDKTAEIVMKAASTGHMVFSTLHTNDAASTLTRLVDMKVPPYSIGDAVEGIISQRLIRVLCERCKVPVEHSQERLEEIGFPFHHLKEGEKPTFYQAVGCKQCSSGFKGRMGIHEVLVVSQAIERAIIEGKQAGDLKQIAQEEGMITVRDDGMLKAAKGLTTIEEIAQSTQED